MGQRLTESCIRENRTCSLTRGPSRNAGPTLFIGDAKKMKFLGEEDTITAISTPLGTAGLGIVRISGPEAIKIADKVFRAKSSKKLQQADNYTVHYGFIIEPDSGRKVDEVITVLMKKPHSFTGENVVEFDCHGGMVPLKRVLNIIIDNGARLAEPGEFSKRAFLNGKMDLIQAESIIEVINSKTEKGLNIAVDHLTGELSAKINYIKNKVVKLMAHLEAAIDFPEDEIEGFQSSELKKRIITVKDNINKLLDTRQQGKIYQEGIKTVIVGKPNVGKSSLLNTLLNEKRAIVTDIPGTTRDVIEEYINLKGIPLKIIDTAGIRETENMVEKIGVERARDFLEKADLVLMMLDVSQGLTDDDLKVYELIKEKQMIVVVNKTDLAPALKKEEIKNHFSEHPVLWISIKEEKGLEELKDEIVGEVFNKQIDSDQVLITRTRHENVLKDALKAIERVYDSYKQGLPYDFLTIDLKECLNKLSEITGETVNEDIIDNIFSDFCLGK